MAIYLVNRVPSTRLGGKGAFLDAATVVHPHRLSTFERLTRESSRMKSGAVRREAT